MKRHILAASTLVLAVACITPETTETVDTPTAAPAGFVVETLAEDQNRPHGLDLRNERLIWANEGKQKDDATGAIMECRTLDCSDGAEPLLDGLAVPRDPRFVGDHIVWHGAWTSNGAGEFGSFAAISAPLDGSRLHWPMLWIGLGDVGAFQVRGDDVFLGTANDNAFLGTCQVEGCPDSGTAIFLITEDLHSVSAMAPGRDDVYVAELTTGEIVRVDRASGAVDAFAEAQIAVFELERDGTHLYWGTSLDTGLGDADEIEVNNYLARQPHDGGPMERLADITELTALTLDDGWLYFGEASGDVSRVPADGGEVEHIASGFERPSGMKVHEGHLYWTDRSRDGGVYRVALP